jgi:hypothetical protein
MAKKQKPKLEIVTSKAPAPVAPTPAAVPAPVAVDPTVDPRGIRMVDEAPEGFRECTAQENQLLEDIRRDTEMVEERRARIRAERAALGAIENGLSAMVVGVQMKSDEWRKLTGAPGPGGIVIAKDGKMYVRPTPKPAGPGASPSDKEIEAILDKALGKAKEKARRP